MAEDPRAGVDPAEEAGRRVREGRAMREAARAEAARRAAVVEEGMEGNRRYARSQDAARKIQNAVTIPEPAANASREAATRNMMRAGRAAAAAPSASVAGADAAVGRALASRALGAVGGGLGMAMETSPAGAGSEDRGNAGLARGMAAREGNRRDAARMMGAEAGRLDAAERRAAARDIPEETPTPTGVAPRGSARSAAPESEDYASTSDIVSAPQRRAETVRRPAPRRAPAPQRMSQADALNQKQLDEAKRQRAVDESEIDRFMRDRVATDEGMKKGGLVKMAKGGQVKGLKPKTMFKPKMAGGGAVRGCGIASRGKTRGRMV